MAALNLRRRALRWRAAALSAVLVLCVTAVAFAHTALVSSNPAKDAVVPHAPYTIRLVYGEPIEASLATIELVSASGSSQQLKVRGDPHDVHAIEADATPDADGAVTLKWHVVSADGHPVSGSYVYYVGSRSGMSAAPQTPSELPLRAAILRAGASFFVIATAGVLAFLAWLLPASGGARAPEYRVKLLSLFALLLCFCHAWAWSTYAMNSTSLDSAVAALTSTAGRAELARIVLCAITVWALLLVRNVRFAAVSAMAAVLATAGIGHAAAISPGLLIPIKAVHLAGTTIWLGGLIILVSGVRNGDDAAYRETAMKVSIVALTAVILIALSGLAQTLFVIKPAELVTTSYGLISLAKVGVLFILIGLGATNRYRNVPAVQRGEAIHALQRTVAWEIAFVAVAFILAGALAYTAPPEHNMTHASTQTEGAGQ